MSSLLMESLVPNFYDRHSPSNSPTPDGWDSLPQGLLIPSGSVSLKKTLRTGFQEAPLETHRKTKVVTMSEPLYNAFRMEMARLEERHLETATDMSHVVAFERAATQLCEEYGLTLALAVVDDADGGPQIIVQTREQIVLEAGEIEEYQMYSDRLHGGAPIQDDLEALAKPMDKMTDRDWELLDS